MKRERESYTTYLRVFIGLMFFVIGLSKFWYFKEYSSLIHFGGLTIYAATIVMTIEIVCGLALMIGWERRYSAAGLAFVLIGALIFVVFPNYNLTMGLLNPLSLATIFLHLLAIGVLLKFVIYPEEN